MNHTRRWTACITLGLRAAWRQRGLVLLVWLLFLAAALLAAAPAWRWWNGALSVAPEGDRLLDGLNAPLLRELSHYDRESPYAMVFGSVSAFLLAALVLNPFVAGGMIAVLLQASRDRDRDGPDAPVNAEPRPSSWTRFFAGGARYYGLCLRLLLFAGMLAIVLAIVPVLVLMPIRSYVGTHNLEQPYLLVTLAFPVAIAIAFWIASLVLDVARIRAVRDRERRAWRAMWTGLRFFWRNLVATLSLGIAFALLAALVYAIYFAVSASVTPKSSLAILLAIVWQQVLSLTRAGVRVSLVAGELELVHARDPHPLHDLHAHDRIAGSQTSNLAPPVEPLPASIDPP